MAGWNLLKHHRTFPDKQMNTWVQFEDLLEEKQLKGVRNYLLRKRKTYAFVVCPLGRSDFLFRIKNKHRLSPEGTSAVSHQLAKNSWKKTCLYTFPVVVTGGDSTEDISSCKQKRSEQWGKVYPVEPVNKFTIKKTEPIMRPWRVLLPVQSSPTFLPSSLPVGLTSAFSHDHISLERCHSINFIIEYINRAIPVSHLLDDLNSPGYLTDTYQRNYGKQQTPKLKSRAAKTALEDNFPFTQSLSNVCIGCLL